VQEGQSAVPYGIAIVCGALVTFAILGYFSPRTLGLFLRVPG
jgi:Flp pilus assembly protein protease CpaA